MEVYVALYIILIAVVLSMLMAICYNWRRFVRELEEIYPADAEANGALDEEAPLQGLDASEKEICRLLRETMLA